MKSCYTRDAVAAVGGGAIVMRLGPRIRRGEELPVTRTLARLGCPILEDDLRHWHCRGRQLRLDKQEDRGDRPVVSCQ